MNDAHLHLLVNHLPIVGAVFSVALVALALFMPKERGALRAAVLLLVLTGGGAVAAQLTGEPAEEVVEELAGVDESQIHEHEERAEAALVISLITAALGIGVLVMNERKGAVPAAASGLLLVASLASAGAMGWTGQAGGPIRHSEIRDEGANPAPAQGEENDEEDDG